MALRTFDLLHLTFLSLKGNLLRSSLTAVGVFMGVAAVNATLQVGAIGRAVIEQQLSAREAPQIYVVPDWNQDDREPLELADMEYLQQRMTGTPAIGTQMWTWFGDEVRFRDRTAEGEIAAISRDFLQTSGRTLLSGREFQQSDFDRYRPVAIIDRIFVEQLFGDVDPIGKKVYWANRPYFIVGTMESKLGAYEDQPKGRMFIPISVYQAMTGWDKIWSISIRADDLESMQELEERAIALLEKRSVSGKFISRNNIEEIMQQKETLKMVSRSLLAVGGIALLVGGVGIANITIASVMERTAEIGLRLAIGATKREVMLQFVLEATVLSLVGGTIAIASVHFITVGVSATFALPYQFSLQTAAFSLGSALLVGVGAGFFPALKASQLDPVQALRSQ